MLIPKRLKMMKFKTNQVPHSPLERDDSAWIDRAMLSRGVLLCGIFLMSLVSMSWAQQTDITQAPINEYLQKAAQDNPALKVQYRQYLEALQEVPQVSSLPDPELSFGYFVNPIETRVGPQQMRFGISQMLPWFGTLNARSDAANERAKGAFQAFQDARNELFFNVQKQWYELYDIEQTIRILKENIEILTTFESLATQQYETDQVGQADVLRVQIEKEDLKTRLELKKDDKRVALQAFNELLNRKSGTFVSIPDSMDEKQIQPTKEEIQQWLLQRNPKLMEKEFQASSARRKIDAARKDGLPSLGFGVDYIVTGERDMALANNGQDALLAKASIQIPLFRKKYRAQTKQAHIQLRAVQDQQSATENRLLTKLEEAWRDYQDAQRRLRLYQDKQIQRTQQTIDILTEQYATSSTDFEELLRLQRKLLDYELARQQALVDQNTAVAHIEYLYGKHNVNAEEIELTN